MPMHLLSPPLCPLQEIGDAIRQMFGDYEEDRQPHRDDAADDRRAVAMNIDGTDVDPLAHLRPAPQLAGLAKQMLREGADLPAANPPASYAPAQSNVGNEARGAVVNAVLANPFAGKME